MKENLYCPRCGSVDISVYKDTFECTKCKDNNGVPFEFYRESFGKLPDDMVLTLQELASFEGVFEELRDSKKRRKFSESLNDDDFES